MNTILSTKTNAIFLSIVLLAGAIAASIPSFMISTQAQPYYNDMNKEKKSDRNISVQSLKCNNINVNVNGLELSVLPPFLGGEVAAEAVEPNTYASSFAAGNNDYGPQINDFRFICINNNNNTVVAEDTPVSPVDECPESDEIESCFRQFLLDALFPNFVDELESGITVEINGQEVTLNSFADICEALEGLTFLDLLEAVDTILSAAGISVGSDVITDIAECIEPVLAL